MCWVEKVLDILQTCDLTIDHELVYKSFYEGFLAHYDDKLIGWVYKNFNGTYGIMFGDYDSCRVCVNIIEAKDWMKELLDDHINFIKRNL